MPTHKYLLAFVLALSVLAFGPVGLAGQDAKTAQDTPPAQQPAQDTIPDRSYKSWSPMPIVMYDTDIGFGFGGKVKFVDFLKMKESFDLIVFQAIKDKQVDGELVRLHLLHPRHRDPPGQALRPVLRPQGRVRQVPALLLLRPRARLVQGRRDDLRPRHEIRRRHLRDGHQPQVRGRGRLQPEMARVLRT